MCSLQLVVFYFGFLFLFYFFWLVFFVSFVFFIKESFVIELDSVGNYQCWKFFHTTKNCSFSGCCSSTFFLSLLLKFNTNLCIQQFCR